MAAEPPAPAASASTHIAMLDGWRAVSILLVLAGHLLPLGPGRWQMNGAVAASGMAIFFTLSGLLITRFLLDRPDVTDFLIRRLFRIVPLAWTAMGVLAVATGAGWDKLAANWLFVANLPPHHLMAGGEHLWSLCVEVQFYAAIALLVLIAGRRGLLVLPFVCLAVTAGRIATGTPISIVTWQRIDEILVGCCIALLLARPRAAGLLAGWPRWTPVAMAVLLLASAHPAAGPLAYARPYFAALAVGSSLHAAPRAMQALFTSRAARYIAEISYALYVIHGMLIATWFGSGATLAKYAKRPLLALATLGLAHLSTFYLERPLISVGKRLSHRRRHRATVGIARGPRATE